MHGIIAWPTKDISTAVVKQGMDIYTHRLYGEFDFSLIVLKKIYIYIYIYMNRCGISQETHDYIFSWG